MTIKTASADIKNVMVAGKAAKSVQLGTGSANVEVWSSYPKTGTWPGGDVPLGVTTQATHTITVAGNFTLNWSVPFTAATNGTLAGARIFVNGDVVKSGPYLNFPGTSTANITRDLAAGDVVEFRTDTSKNDAVASGGTWTITKN